MGQDRTCGESQKTATVPALRQAGIGICCARMLCESRTNVGVVVEHVQGRGGRTNQASNHWGVELNGADEDKKVWQMLLKPPFYPFVEEIGDERGDYLVLRSTTFDGVTGSEDVQKLAKQLFRTLNVVMSENVDTDPITNGAVVEFVPNGQPRKHPYDDVEGLPMRARVGRAKPTAAPTQRHGR